MISYLGIGSNIDAETNIKNAMMKIAEKFPQCRFSRVFESEAVGFDGANFLNLVAEIETTLSLEALVIELKALEDKLGRRRGGEKFSSRHIDIDILLFGTLTCEKPVELPRAEIVENAYVLWPLTELVPTRIDPDSNKTYQMLWEQFDKQSQVIRPLKLQPFDS